MVRPFPIRTCFAIRTALAALAVRLVATVGIAFGQAARDDAFLEGLRARRLHALAASLCDERLAPSSISGPQRAKWTSELIRVHAERAMFAAAAERPLWWERAHQTAARYAERPDAVPDAVLVPAQDAIAFLAEGRVAREEAEVARDAPDPRVADALTAIRAAVRAFEELETRLEKEIPTAPATRSDGGLVRDDLFALRNQLRIHRAEALRNRALCYRDGEDRIAALTAALEPLADALGQLPPDDPLAWRIRIEQSICRRLLGDIPEARRVQAAWSDADVPVQLRADLLAEQMRLALAERDLDRAKALADPEPPPGRWPDLDLARLEVLVRLWQPDPAGGPDASPRGGPERDRAIESMKAIERRHGAYWGRRAEQLVLRSAGEGRSVADVEILRRRADDLYLRNQWAESLAAYDAAAAAAAKAGAADDAFLCRSRGARLAEKTGNLDDALRRWRELALAMRSHAQAPSAHFESITLAVRLARTDPARIGAYRELLDEHLAQWPRGGESDRVRVWLANLRTHEKEWDAALARYGEVSVESAMFTEAVAGAARAWAGKLADAGQDAAPADVDAMLAFWQAWQAGSETPVPVDLAVARLLLDFAPRRVQESEARLRRVLESVPAEDPRVAEARSLLVVALALQPERHADAVEAARAARVANRSFAKRFALLRDLEAHAARLPPAGQRSLAVLQLESIDTLRGEATDAADQRELDRLRAVALRRAERGSEALDAYARLAAEFPSDASIQLEYARVIESEADRVGWPASLERWRHVARFTRPRSDAWYESKCGVARALVELGQKDEAAKVLRHVLLTQPPDRGTQWDRAVRSLLDSIPAEEKR